MHSVELDGALVFLYNKNKSSLYNQVTIVPFFHSIETKMKSVPLP